MTANKIHLFNKKVVYLLLFLIVNMGVLKAQIVINELCPKNESIAADADGDFVDWIELYNPSTEVFDLSFHYLSDDLSEPQKWQFTAGITISPNSFLLVFASDKDRFIPDIHSSFKLSQVGETVLLSLPDGTLLDELTYAFTPADYSYGRLQNDTNTKAYFTNPTPLAPNDDGSAFASNEPLHPPSLSHETGLYEEAFELTLTSEQAEVNIYYTTDGSLPTLEAMLYTAPLFIDSTMVISASCFSSDGSQIPSTISHQSFFWEEDGGLPILSIITPPQNLWSEEEGILITGPNASETYPYYGANYWEDWEIPIHLSYLEKGTLAFQQQLDMKTHGGRAARTKPMKSLRLLAKDKYEQSYIYHPIFDTKPSINKYKRLVLRNASSDFNKAHFRDAFVHQLVATTPSIEVDILSYQPAMVYLNGAFYGLFNIREKADKYYIESNYQYEPDDLDILEEDTILVQGSFEQFDAMVEFANTHNLNNTSHYETVVEQLAINSYVDYFITQLFFANIDWPYNNLKCWKPQIQNGLWRYLLFDLDATLRGSPAVLPQTDQMTYILGPAGDNLKHVQLFKGLLQNTSFKHYFINRYADLMNTTYSETSLLIHLETMKNGIAPVIPLQFERWESDISKWTTETNLMIPFIEERPSKVRTHMETYFELSNQVNLQLKTIPENAGSVELNSITIGNFPWEGIYFNGVPIDLNAIAKEGFVFSHWQSNNTILPMDFNSAINYNFTTNDTITAYFVPSNLNENNPFISYPNPSSDKIQLQFLLAEEEIINLQVYNAKGQLMEAHEFAGILGANYFELNVSTYLHGIYFIQLAGNSFCHTQSVAVVD